VLESIERLAAGLFEPVAAGRPRPPGERVVRDSERHAPQQVSGAVPAGLVGRGRFDPSGAGRPRPPSRFAPEVRRGQPLGQQAGGVGHDMGLATFVDGQRDHLGPVLHVRRALEPPPRPLLGWLGLEQAVELLVAVRGRRCRQRSGQLTGQADRLAELAVPGQVGADGVAPQPPAVLLPETVLVAKVELKVPLQHQDEVRYTRAGHELLAVLALEHGDAVVDGDDQEALPVLEGGLVSPQLVGP
jgi:hypothetical protein